MFSGMLFFKILSQKKTNNNNNNKRKEKIHRCKHLSFYVYIYLLWVTLRQTTCFWNLLIYTFQDHLIYGLRSLRPATHCAILTVWHMLGHDIKFTVRTMKTQTKIAVRSVRESTSVLRNKVSSAYVIHFHAATLKQETERRRNGWEAGF